MCWSHWIERKKIFRENTKNHQKNQQKISWKHKNCKTDYRSEVKTRLTCGEDIIIPFINGSIRCKEAKFMRSSDGSILAFWSYATYKLETNFVMIYFRVLLNRENDELFLSFLSLRQFRSENAQRWLVNNILSTNQICWKNISE